MHVLKALMMAMAATALVQACDDRTGEIQANDTGLERASLPDRPQVAIPDEKDAGRSRRLGSAGAGEHKGAVEAAPTPLPARGPLRFVGRWATAVGDCPSRTWQFTRTSLRTPAGSVCAFSNVQAVPGGYDIAATCTAEGPPNEETLKIRFAESAKAMLFESDAIADAGLIPCA
jgi:hypothetical protein